MKEEEESPLNEPFSWEEWQAVVKRLGSRSNKAAGPDGVAYWMFSDKAPEEFHKVLLSLLNLAWEWEKIPTQWSMANVRYLYKGKG